MASDCLLHFFPMSPCGPDPSLCFGSMFPMFSHFSKCFRDFVLFPGWRREPKSHPHGMEKKRERSQTQNAWWSCFEPVVPDALAVFVCFLVVSVFVSHLVFVFLVFFPFPRASWSLVFIVVSGFHKSYQARGHHNAIAAAAAAASAAAAAAAAAACCCRCR